MLEQLREQGLARLDRLAPQIPAVELEQIEGEQDDVLAPTGKAILVACDRLAIDQAGAATQQPDGDGDRRIALAPIKTVSREQPHAGGTAPRHDAVAAMLDFMNPTRLRRRPFGRARQAGRNEACGTRSVGAHMPLLPED